MLAASRPILKEVERVFDYPRIKSVNDLKEKEIKAITSTIKKYSIVTPGKAKINKTSVDPTDDMFLICAKEAEADFSSPAINIF